MESNLLGRNFFLASPSYEVHHEKMKDGRGVSLLLQKAIIAKHLSAKCKIRTSSAEIMAELAANGVACTKSSLRKNIEIYQVAYRYLNGEKDIIQKRIDRNDSTTRSLRYLIEDKLDSWKKVIAALDKKQKAEAIAAAAKAVPVEADKEVPSADLTDKNSVSEAGPGLEVGSEQRLTNAFIAIRQVRDDFLVAIEVLKEETQKKVNLLFERESKIESLQSRITVLQEENFALVQQNTQIVIDRESELQEFEKMLGLADSEIKSLEEQNENLSEKLERIRQSLGNAGIVLADLIEKNSEVDLAEDGELVFDALPKNCDCYSKPFVFGEGFRDDFEAFEKRDRKIVIKALEFFSQQGPDYSSLRSRKQFYSTNKLTKGEMKYRAGKFLRFTLKNEDDAVYITGLYKIKDLIKK